MLCLCLGASFEIEGEYFIYMANFEQGNSMNLGGAGNGQLISLLDILRIVRNRWKLGAFLGIIVASVFLYAVFSREKLYEAEASLTVELSTENVMNIREVVDTKLANVNLLNAFLNTHIERLKARAISEAVVATLSEPDYVLLVEAYVGPLSERDPEKGPPNAARLLQKNALKVERGAEDESQVLRVIITHPNPFIAQKMADAYVEQYILYQAGLRSASTSEVVKFLGRQVEEMRVDLEAAEMALQDFRQEHQLLTLRQDQGGNVDRLKRLNQAVTDARIRLLEVESRRDQIAAVGNDLERLMEVPAIGGRSSINKIYNQLNELKRKRKVLDGTYLRRHPKIVENTASQLAVAEALTRLVEQTRRQIVSDCQAIESEIASFQKQLDEGGQDIFSSDRALIEYKQLERSVLSKREIYDTLATRYNETSIAQEMNLNSFRVLDRAEFPGSPNTPSHAQVGAAALFLFGLFLIGVPLAIELCDGRLSSFSDIESYSGKPLLGDLRLYPKKSFEEITHAVFRKDPDLLEPFRAIYSSLRLKTDLKGDTLSLVVTSSLPGEGKSSISCNLSAAFATHKYRVLLIDCDLRRPSLHRAFDVDNDHGITKWYDSQDADPHAAREQEAELLGILPIHANFSLLTAGEASIMPTEILGDPRTADLFERIKKNFDIVIFDTAPVGLFPDATLVADYADECVFVARQFKVSKAKARYSIGLMDRSTVSVLGVIFNGVKDVTAAVGYGSQAANQYGLGYEKNAKKYNEYYAK